MANQGTAGNTHSFCGWQFKIDAGLLSGVDGMGWLATMLVRFAPRRLRRSVISLLVV
jgi:hypothetical protein